MTCIRTRRHRNRRGNGTYSTSSIKTRRTPGRGKFVPSLKAFAKYAAKNAPTILKGARYLAGKRGNKTIRSLANSGLLDQGAAYLSNLGGRGTIKSSAVKLQAKNIIQKLIKLHGVEGTRKFLRSYLKTRGQGNIGKVLGSIMSSIVPF